MTTAVPTLVALSRLSRLLVRCTDQAECDRMEIELAALRAKAKREEKQT